MGLPLVWSSIPTIRSSLSRRTNCTAESECIGSLAEDHVLMCNSARTASSSRLKAAVTAWVLPVEASVTEGLEVVAVHLTHMPRLVVPAGAVAVLPTRMLRGEGRPQPGAPQKRPTHTRKGVEHLSVRAPKPRIRTRKRVGEHQLGALLGHRIHMRPRVGVVAPDRDGGAQHPLGVVRHRSLPLGTRVRLCRLIMELITAGPVQDQHREVGASRVG